MGGKKIKKKELMFTIRCIQSWWQWILHWIFTFEHSLFFDARYTRTPIQFIHFEYHAYSHNSVYSLIFCYFFFTLSFFILPHSCLLISDFDSNTWQGRIVLHFLVNKVTLIQTLTRNIIYTFLDSLTSSSSSNDALSSGVIFEVFSINFITLELESVKWQRHGGTELH